MGAPVGGAELPIIVGIAFTAGMVAFFSPCCAAMLPAYVSYALGRSEKAPGQATAKTRRAREVGGLCIWAGLLMAALGLARLALDSFNLASSGGLSWYERHASVLLALGGTVLALAGYAAISDRAHFRKALLFGALATAGLLLVFGALAFPLAAAGPVAATILPVLAAAVGVALVVLGVLTLAHKLPALRLPFLDPAREGFAGFFLYGVAYGLASLACTFPIFLAVVAVAAFSGPITLLLAVGAYALGKGAVLTLVTVLATASPTAVEGKLRKILPHFERVMAGITIAAGAFIAYYFGVLYAA